MPQLCIEFNEALRHAEGHVVVHLVAGPVSIGYKEPAGVAFHTAVLRQQGLLNEGGNSSEEEQDASDPDNSEPASPKTPNDESDKPPPGVSWKKSGANKKKKDSKKKKDDLYGLLGLKNERWMATAKQLKDSYRKVCLEHHPDKKLVGVTDEAEKEAIEEHFKKIQEAYTVLSDPAKRREYDSVDEFDDSLPSDCASKDFFKVFGPAFRRNVRWSINQKNVPDVGDENTPYEEVEKFYNFWFTFKSWREFPHPDEEDVEGAEGRDHRRWIERNNAKLREKAKKEDGRRLREFVENAYRIDPRVVAKKEEDRLERERKKQEKEDAKRAVIEEEERRKAEEEAARNAAEEEKKAQAAEAKRLREAAKKELKKERQRLRAINEGGGGADRLLHDDDLEDLTQKLDIEAMRALSDSLCVFGISREEQREIAEQRVAELSIKQSQEAKAKEAQKKATEEQLKGIAKRDHAKKMEAMTEWSEEELRMLDKAVAKFPIGTPKRWEAVTAYVRTRTLEEVLLIVKGRQGMSAARTKQSEDFKLGQKKRAEVKAEADLRMNAFTDVNVNLVGAAAALVDPTVAAAAAEPAAPATPAAAAEPPAAAAAPAADPAAAAAAAAAGPKVVVSADSGEWTEEQELALVKAMKQFGKELSDRWERVAEVVPGKSKVQCFKRFKELRDVFRTKKAGGAGGEE